MKKILLLVLMLFSSVTYSQTTKENLNEQIQQMRTLFLGENYSEYSNFIHPKVLEIMGGKQQLIEFTKSSFQKMKNDGFYLLDLTYKDLSEFIQEGQKIQLFLTEQLLMQTPKGKVLAESTLIGISDDNGKNWKFIGTSGKTKEDVLKIFPNLSPENN